MEALAGQQLLTHLEGTRRRSQNNTDGGGVYLGGSSPRSLLYRSHKYFTDGRNFITCHQNRSVIDSEFINEFLRRTLIHSWVFHSSSGAGRGGRYTVPSSR